MNVIKRDALLTNAGKVLPSAWNMPEHVKMMPDATKLSEMICRNSTPTRMTSGSVLAKGIRIHSARNWQITVSTNMSALPIMPAFANVSRARSGLPAPTFCPATGDAANAIAIAGRKMDCITREPMLYPAWACAPNFEMIT